MTIQNAIQTLPAADKTHPWPEQGKWTYEDYLRLDQHVKFGAYEQAGLREYWIADPKTRSIIVYSLPENSPEYVLVGQFTAEEQIQSNVLPGLTFATESVFTVPSN